MGPEKDIETREDLEILLREFYNVLLKDDSINYIFTDVARIDMEAHIPVITDFWEMVLFQTGSYRKNAIQVHTELNKLTPLTAGHFKTWLHHFNNTVDRLYNGSNAFQVKQRAASIATIMQIKIKQTGP